MGYNEVDGSRVSKELSQLMCAETKTMKLVTEWSDRVHHITYASSITDNAA
jgi:hypothetical protein